MTKNKTKENKENENYAEADVVETEIKDENIDKDLLETAKSIKENVFYDVNSVANMTDTEYRATIINQMALILNELKEINKKKR